MNDLTEKSKISALAPEDLYIHKKSTRSIGRDYWFLQSLLRTTARLPIVEYPGNEQSINRRDLLSPSSLGIFFFFGGDM